MVELGGEVAAMRIGSRSASRPVVRAVLFALALVASVSLLGSGPAMAASAQVPLPFLGELAPAGAQTSHAVTLADAFAAATRRYAVPEPLLLAIAYEETRWNVAFARPDGDGTAGNSSAGSYGIMALYETPTHTGTLPQAAHALGISLDTLKHDPAANIAGAAAVLAVSVRATNGATSSPPPGLDQWYGAVATYVGVAYPQVARDFANSVYHLTATGMRARASTGELLTLAPHAVHPDMGTFPAPGALGPQPAQPRALAQADYPGVDAYLPAAPTSYTPASRPGGGLFVQYIIIHDTEGDYPSVVRTFTSAGACCSAHFLIDGESSGGYPTVTQFVATHDISYQAGNWWYNQHAIGIEHVSFADQPAGYYTQKLYDASARLVAYLCMTYNIPIDRAHILGHGNVPAYTSANVHGMHWDPGPFWDWAYYLARVRQFYAQLSHNAPLPSGSGPLRTSTAASGTIRSVDVNADRNLASDIGGWTSGVYQNFANVYADASGAPSSALTLGASNPATWTSPSSYNTRDFSCDTLPNATQTGGSWRVDANSDHRAKAEFGEEVALQRQRTRRHVLYDQISFDGATGWVRARDTAPGAGRIVRFRGGQTPTTLYGAPILNGFNAICSDAANGFSRAGQSYVAEIELVDGTNIMWYQIFYNHRVAWVPASEVRAV
jgi:hypothetical protein